MAYALVRRVKRLKDRTLRNSYEQRSLREGKAVLLEALDTKKLEAASQAIARLEGLVPDQADMFNMALVKAKDELDAYIKGGVKQSFKNLLSDPVAKATSLAFALETGFAQLPKVLKLYLPKGTENESQRSCLEMVPEEDKKNALIATMVKSFAPTGTGSVAGDIKSMFSDNAMPYVMNLRAATAELLQNVAPTGAFKLGQQAASAPKVEPETAADPQAKPGAPPAGNPAATSSNPTAPTAPSQAAKGSAPTTDSSATAASQSSKTPSRITIQDTAAINDLAQYLTKKVGLDAPTLTKVLQQLAKDQKLVG